MCSDVKSLVFLLVTFFNVRTPAVWSLDAWGIKSTLTLDTIKLFFELVNEAFIDVDEDDVANELKKLKGYIMILRLNKWWMGLTWSVEPSDREDHDQRSGEVESQIAIELENDWH